MIGVIHRSFTPRGRFFMQLQYELFGMTHGLRLSGADPSLANEGIFQIHDMDVLVYDALKRFRPITTVVVGMENRLLETHKLVERVLDLLGHPKTEYSWFLGAGGSVDGNTGLFVTDTNMRFPITQCVPIGSLAAWYHLITIDQTRPGNKLFFATKQFFSNLGVTTKTASLYRVVWKTIGHQEQKYVECLVRGGKAVKKISRR